jgi:uncharacterized protein
MITNREEILKDSIILISRFNDEAEEFSLGQETPWVAEIIDKISADYEPETEQVKDIKVDLKLTRNSNGEYGEYLFVEGEVSGSYIATCIRCLVDTPQNFTKEFKGAFINGRLENEPEYEEIDEIFVNNQQADLFFHQRGKANLNDIVAEACFMAVDHYPVHAEDCKGLCHTCGINLNTDTCKH